uniref:Cubilin n=1 Tax=Biomphalaria glabrata TaxID=6526 RepID=A0A2C9JE70_BIOGL
MFWDNVIPLCPCSEYFAQMNGWWFTALEYNDFCYQSYIPYYRGGRKCCYRRDGWLLNWWQMSTFYILLGIHETRMPLAGSLQLYSPYYSSYYGSYWYYNNFYNSYYGNVPIYGSYWYFGDSSQVVSHQQEDLDPKTWCCELSDLCYLYYQVRPLSTCVGSTFYYGYFFGDPHIMTLDERSYIFNGLGEYRIVEISGQIPGGNTSLSIKLQGRTCRATNSQGNLTDATVWCALVLQTNNNKTLRINLANSKDSLIIYANEQDYTLRFKDNVNFIAVDKDITLRRDNESLRVTTLDEFGITVSITNQFMQFTVSINQKYRNLTRGLLGNFNGDITDDFVFPNGTQLPDNSSERILFEYGKTWAVTDESTLFVYDLPGQNTSTFTDPTFTPIFLDEVNATVRAEAEKVCDSKTNLPCIFDYIATKNVLVARSSMAAAEMFTIQNLMAANQVPVCDGANGFNLTVNETLTFDLKCSDADNDSLSVKIISQPLQGFSYNFSSSTGVLSITYTPVSTANVSLDVQFVCSDLNCDKDKDGCTNKPCPDGTNCTDVSAEEESQTGHAFNCSNCPSGFELVLNGTKCQDINECDDNTTQWCDVNAVCINSIGSFQCTCRPGFRLLNKRCIDINECTDNLHSCQQLCINQSPLYTCDCYEGYVSSGYNCTKVQVSDVCKNHSCEYGCRNNSGQPECFCQTGFKLADNGTACIDIDECAENLCSQGCNNTIGSYSCFCFDGFVKSLTDRHYCDVCAANRYGKDCNLTCNCRGRAGRCDNVKGCICSSSWTGVNCEQDVDECSLKLAKCSSDQMCTNTNGSYTCDCPTGYELRNSTCENINECNDRLISNCTQLCIDSVGSFSCQCRDGYILGDDGSCLDLDECTAKTSGCEHKCDNTLGSFNCECFPGFVLNDDRRTCRKAQDTCESVNMTCQFDCTVFNNIPQCFCKAGYILGTDNSTCIDVNECNIKGNRSDENLCTDQCNNLEGSYECSCPAGKALQIDRRTCKECDSFHWGNNCSENCGCYPMGSERCDPILGCICKPGWAGQDCKQDVNECNYQVSPCPVNTDCINIAGSFNCQCRTGFNLVNESCEDIDECSSRSPCDHNCENIPGSYVCSCFKGFNKNRDKCEDIDECTVPLLNKCDQICRNTLGGYACECFDGYSLNITNRNTCDLLNATKVCKTSSCDQLCTLNASNVEVCSCHAGYELQSNKCINIDECASKPCLNGTCKDGVGNYTCTCSTGFKLASDLKTCLECEEGYYGINCNSSCQCTSTNTVSCNTTDGTCLCKPGWQGQDCSVDIDECSKNGVCYNNSQCINSQGSYKCVCTTGYLSTGSSCVACSPIHYGQDCNNSCSCIFANTLDCNHISGKCNCKPGWTGVNCELDINECSNSSYCSADHVECINLNGSAECRCLPGYERPANSTTCQDINECLNPKLTKCPSLKTCNNTQGSFVCICEKGFQEVNGVCTACDSTHFGHNCSSVCDCFVANSADCNDVDGQCLCNKGWTGPKCDRLIDQCANASFCTAANEACYNISGVLSCDCATGFYKPSSGASCQDCDNAHFGQNCLNSCQCDIHNSLDCNDMNGTCSCKAGWAGTNCEQDIDECAINSTFCSNLHEVCHNLVGSAECVCESGYYRPTMGSACQACDSTHWGQNCSNVCQCDVSNSLDCNDVDGTCTCKTGWTGTNCSQDIDECAINSTICSNLHEVCHNLKGSAECICQDGFYNSTILFSCQACDSLHYGANCTSVCSCHTTNTADCNDVNGTCSCKPGWTGADCSQGCDSLHYGQDCTLQCKCQLNNSAVCNSTDGHCTCLSGWTGDDCGQAVTSAQVKDLIIGLSVGIPLFVLLLIIIIIILCVCLRKRRRNTGSHTPTEDWESPFRSIFPTRLNTKESWGSPSVYSPDGFSDAASSTGSMDGQLIKSISSKNSAVQDTTWNHSEVINRERDKGIGANFSWDYMFNILQHHRGFEIQRPIIDPSPNPAFATPPREDDSHA